MLVPAKLYEEQLKNCFQSIWFNEKYKFYNACSYFKEKPLAEDTWNYHQFVSVVDNIVIGYIGYSVDRDINSAYGLEIINFSDTEKMIFALDLAKALKGIFETFKFRKLTFSVIVGNPVEENYDKMIKRYGGHIVGTYFEEVKLFDGKYYDKKVYEITLQDYNRFKGSF